MMDSSIKYSDIPPRKRSSAAESDGPDLEFIAVGVILEAPGPRYLRVKKMQ